MIEGSVKNITTIGTIKSFGVQTLLNLSLLLLQNFSKLHGSECKITLCDRVYARHGQRATKCSIARGSKTQRRFTNAEQLLRSFHEECTHLVRSFDANLIHGNFKTSKSIKTKTLLNPRPNFCDCEGETGESECTNIPHSPQQDLPEQTPLEPQP